MSIARKGRPGRPPVTVVMPFAGSRDEAWAAVEALGRLHVHDGDELLLADNAGVLGSPEGGGFELRTSTGVSVAIAGAQGERSPAHARNAGAAAAGDHTEWILFLDADTVAPAALLHSYFAEPIADDVGAVAGGIAAAPPGLSAGIVARYGAHKNFLDAGAHLAHPFMPRAAAANLLVRRTAFDTVGGFFEGLRAAEDTDFSWRLQRAGWTLIGRPSAAVEHQYRDSLRALRRQWRGYAAGRAWLGRRYDGFAPQPALLRVGGPARIRGPASQPPRVTPSRADRARFAALDVVLAVEELFGFALSNRPPGGRSPAPGARRVLVADRFPDAETGAAATADPGDTRACPVRIEAGGRADQAAPPIAGVTVVYREDDGLLDRARALAGLLARRPGGMLAAAAARDDDAPSPATLAPAACRLLADPDATLSSSTADPIVQATARRLGRMAGRGLPHRAVWREMLTRRAKASERIAAPDEREPKAPG